MEMTFGKYKGKTVEEVFQMNPGYFKWMKENGLTEKEEYDYFVHEIPDEYPELFKWEVDIRSGYKCWKCIAHLSSLWNASRGLPYCRR